ncbi:DNA repair exonuclease SbcCD ATPase subunit [Pelagirhabdus alkalitolerans]|uniref:Nuclease SbcCD subunit C n=1 Tax=Pelagirhabdus alkalitolerans TaxID=1612202 RepID=A0A1G6LH85_9BACI|nr:AAA family ATPase [Pelagirhabdus alkalitolerans]SDC42648.1 DNA repair exonuclease SbcCD ATPase subunit [Pelagirhabdus alkalitolerans]
MKIHKIYLKNFKGIKDKKIIEFENQTNLLIGPNGFGKTTIYDALELCLTSKIHRTLTKGAVTHHRKDYNKLFFQNNENEDVIVKVWLKKKVENKSKDLIITKYLPKDEEKRVYRSGRKHKPDDFYILQTYIDYPDDFSADTFNPEEHKELTSKEINNFFDFNSPDMEIKDIYNLFNYLQQEETTFFLKQSEKDRKDSLSFLFNTNKEEAELQRISNMLSTFNHITNQLKDKIDAYKTVQKVDAVEYTTLFPNQDIKFDKETLFENKDIDVSFKEREGYLKEIKKIISFINRFEPDEYYKMQNVNFLESKIKNDEFINYFILHKLIKTKHYDLLKGDFELKEDTFKLKAFILQHHVDKYQEYKTINRKHEEYDAFLSLTDLDEKIEKVEEFVEKIMPKTKEDFLELIKYRKELNAATSDIEGLMMDMIQLRNRLKEKLDEYKKDENYDSSCPYCGFIWKTYEELNKEFRNKEESFRKSLNDQSNKLVEVEQKLTSNFINPIIHKMRKYKEENKIIDKKILELLGEFKNKEFDFLVLTEYVSDKIAWNKLGSYEDLKEDFELLKENIEKNMKVSSELFEMMRNLVVQSYDYDLKKIRRVVPEKELAELVFDDINKPKTLQDLKNQSGKLKKLLEERKQVYTFENNKVEDADNLYEVYFQSKKDNFYKINEAELEHKVAYINFVFSQNQSEILNVYKDRKRRLDNIIENMNNVRDNIKETIKNHKREMANNIKLPFYIYTAKILQNYQQGMGIFLSTKDKSDAIKFLTDTSSDHDAIHHLSSGQLAVTSIAFTLAINKTYNISKNLKFLAIDDPIQEMDSMNIHSFVELIRHEFLNDYQLIFSTHNDNNALFMKYKFEKMNSKQVSLIDVQSKFFY